jgi:hypothetical protein
MTPALAEFIAASELPAALGGVGAIARAFLAMSGEPAYHISLLSKAGIVIGSVCLAVGVAFAVEQIAEVKKWAPLAALCMGYAGQNAAMRLTRRVDRELEQIDEKFDDRFHPQQPKNPDDKDHV